MDRRLPLSLGTLPRSLPLGDGGHLRLWTDWLAPRDAEALFDRLRSELPWQQRHLRIAGRDIAEPRLTAWFGDPTAEYTYSGLSLSPEPWPPLLAGLRTRLEAELEERFNSVLCNLYRNGNDSVGFHADDEPELGREPVIASVSLGATRRFVLKHKRDKRRAPVSVLLESGTLLVMDAGTQRRWVHALPKQRAPVGARINLTFRLVAA